MPERILPGLGLRAFYDPGQRNWGTSLSEDLRRLSALVQPRATSRSTALPGTGSTAKSRSSRLRPPRTPMPWRFGTR